MQVGLSSLVLMSLMLAHSCNGMQLVLDPFDPIPMLSSNNLTLRLTFDEVADEEKYWNKSEGVLLSFNLTNEASWAVEVVQTTLNFTYDDIRKATSKVFQRI